MSLLDKIYEHLEDMGIEITGEKDDDLLIDDDDIIEGKAEKIVNKAKLAGATGASIFYGRGTGESEVKKFLNISFNFKLLFSSVINLKLYLPKTFLLLLTASLTLLGLQWK